jgi:sugar/nucleoside kinase (ribokinase family)
MYAWKMEVYMEIEISPVLAMVGLTFVSNLAVDTISGIDGIITPSLGGPPCYGGIMALELGIRPNLVTRFGTDLKEDDKMALKNKGLILKSSCISNLGTTKFKIQCLGRDRRLFLQSKCDMIRLDDVRHAGTDGWLVSPILDEVPPLVLDYIRSNPGHRNFILLDPQGYTRAVDCQGMISIKQEVDLDLKGVTAIKLDPLELGSLTGGLSGPLGIKKIHDHFGIKLVIFTEENTIHVSDGRTDYWLPLVKKNSPDSTGIGDILSSAFTCTFLKEKDLVWALCFAVGAASASLDSGNRGLEKIPSYSVVEENASYFYNMVNFAKL